MSADLAMRGAALLGGVLAHAETLSGGNLSTILRIVLTDGREAVVKTGPSPDTEAAMLAAIRASGAPAPAVLGCDDAVLVIEALPGGDPLSGAWASLGAALSTLHKSANAAEGEHYGWERDYAFGPVAIVNAWSGNWPSFWAENRLLVHVRHCPSDAARRIETLAAGLGNRLPARPRAALLHGDLWGGNVLASGGRVTGLIDPACYFGHAEVDLAMLDLFDRPGPAFRERYGAPEPGQRERSPIYRLWPALVHLRLFGSGYRSTVEGCLAQAGV